MSPPSWRTSGPPTSPAASSAPSPSWVAPPGAAPPSPSRAQWGDRGHHGRCTTSDRRARMTTATPPTPTTLGDLRASGHRYKAVKHELRDNLLRRLAEGGERFPGIVGFDDTVLPELERALLAGHDIVLLGERGQGKTRLIRSLHHLLDEWTPAVAGCEINDHPYVPTCVGDLIGDIDPIKVSECRTLGDPETIHYGLVPRTNRGIFSVNELPDLAERIQVALLNVLEERDIQVRGYTLRLPLDLLLVASANPEDYTNRGRIITPLKDRFGAEIRTHYPLGLADEVALVAQEARLTWADTARPAPMVPDHLVEVIARYARAVRDAPQVDQRSGVSARFAIAGIETVAASAVRRAAVTGEPLAVARVCDLPAVVPASRGKVEFEDADEGREVEVLEHLLRRAVADTFRARLAGQDLSALQSKFDEGLTVETGDLVPAGELLRQVGTFPTLATLLSRLRRLAKDDIAPGRTVYGN